MGTVGGTGFVRPADAGSGGMARKAVRAPRHLHEGRERSVGLAAASIRRTGRRHRRRALAVAEKRLILVRDGGASEGAATPGTDAK